MEKRLNLLGVYKLILKDKIYIFICILVAVLLINFVFAIKKSYESKIRLEANISPTALLNGSTNGLITNKYYYESIFRSFKNTLFSSDNFELWKKNKLLDNPNFKANINFKNLDQNYSNSLKIELKDFSDLSMELKLKSPKINNAALIHVEDYLTYTNKLISSKIKIKHINLVKKLHLSTESNALDCDALSKFPAQYFVCISKKEILNYDRKYYNVFFKSDEWKNDKFYTIVKRERFKLVTMAPLFQNILAIILAFFISLIIIFVKAAYKKSSVD